MCWMKNLLHTHAKIGRNSKISQMGKNDGGNAQAISKFGRSFTEILLFPPFEVSLGRLGFGDRHDATNHANERQWKKDQASKPPENACTGTGNGGFGFFCRLFSHFQKVIPATKCPLLQGLEDVEFFRPVPDEAEGSCLRPRIVPRRPAPNYVGLKSAAPQLQISN